MRYLASKKKKEKKRMIEVLLRSSQILTSSNFKKQLGFTHGQLVCSAIKIDVQRSAAFLLLSHLKS